MGQSEQETVREALVEFVDNLKWLRDKSGLSQTSLGQKMTDRGLDLSQKSISHIETFAVDPGFSNLASIAAYFGVPLWVMIVPGLNKELLEGDRLKRLVKLMKDYMDCDDTSRAHTENMAAGYADLARKR